MSYNFTACTGKLCAFNGYDSEIHPGISQEFQTAAMRFGHTLVTPGLWLRFVVILVNIKKNYFFFIKLKE